MVEPIEMLFGMWNPVSPGNHVLGHGPDPRSGRGIFVGRKGVPPFGCPTPLKSIGKEYGEL